MFTLTFNQPLNFPEIGEHINSMMYKCTSLYHQLQIGGILMCKYITSSVDVYTHIFYLNEAQAVIREFGRVLRSALCYVFDSWRLKSERSTHITYERALGHEAVVSPRGCLCFILCSVTDGSRKRS